MKTIRQGTFETNSSSTHSISVSTIGEKNTKTPPLVEGGVIYPSRLRHYADHFGESTFLRCDTVEKKVALLYSWLHEAKLRWNDDLTDEQAKELELVTAKMTGLYVDLDNKYGNYYTTEFGDDDPPIAEWGKDIESFKKYVQDVILNPTIEITDSNEEY